MAKTKVESVGGIRVASNVKSLGKTTPDEPTRTFTIEVELRECDSTIDCGFQQVWGEIKEIDLTLTAGAGWGSKWATISHEGKRYAIDSTQLVAAFLDAVTAESSLQS